MTRPRLGFAFALSGAFVLAMSPAMAQDAAKGERVFARCKACHTLEAGKNRVGPTLHNVFGRQAGGVEGFRYSDAMAGSGIAWTAETISDYVADPRGYIPGNKMAFAGIKDEQQRADLIAYLQEAAGGDQAAMVAAEPGEQLSQAPAEDEAAAGEAQVAEEPKPSFTVALRNAEGDPLGNVELTETPTGLLIRARLLGLTPGMHGFHIHETGKCDPPSFETAGGHWNPTDAEHGFFDESHHLGDLPNLVADGEGKAWADIFVHQAQITASGENSLRDQDGSALIVHAQADDYTTDPAGASGPRVACGVIEPAS